MSIKEECEYVKKLPSKERETYLRNVDFRKRLLGKEAPLEFTYLLEDLEGEELLYLLDDNFIPLLINDVNLPYKLRDIMTCGNPYNNVFLKKSKIVEAMYNNSESLGLAFGVLNTDFGQTFLNYLLSVGDLEPLHWFSPNVKLDLLKDNSIFLKIKSLKPDSSIFDIFYLKEAIEYLLSDRYYENLFLDMNIYSIARIIKKGVSLPSYLSNSNILINKYLAIDNNITFLEFLTDLEKNNVYLKDILKNRKKQEYDDKIKKFNIEDSELLEVIIIFNYEEIPYNFLKNVSSIISYIKQIGKIIIPTNRYQIYEKLVNFASLTKDDKIKLYYEISNNRNAMEEFYDDFKTCLSNSYKDIKNSVTDINNLKMSSLSSKYGVSVYELNGEPFKLLINCTFMYRDGSDSDELWGSPEENISLSVIGDAHLGTYQDPYENVIVGFNQFDYMNIIHTYHSDSNTDPKYASDKILDLYTTDNLLKNTIGYNEVFMKNRSSLTPDFIICYDGIKIGDIEASKILGNIPLVLIHTDKYGAKKTMTEEYEDFDENKYMEYKEARSIGKRGRYS